MKRLRIVKQIVILLSILAIVSWISTSIAAAEDSPPATSSLIVKLIAGLSPEQQAAVIATNGGIETSSIPALRLHVVEVPTDQLSTIIQNYQNDPSVVSVEENKERKAEGEPSDTDYGNQWALPKIGWDQVFGTITPTGSTTVAILDTGVDASHGELAGKLVTCTSILDGSDCTSDPHGHGTWMAGIIAANTDNNNGIAGIGYAGVKIIPVTVLEADGTGQDSDIIKGIIWAVDNGADVILMGFSNPGFSPNLQDAIDYAWENNVVLVAATGNDGVDTPTFPAGDRGVIGVSATDQSDNFVSSSNYGQDVFLAAPGIDIETIDTNNSFTSISGTSSSAAIAAGVAAFMRATDPALTNGVIVGRLARNADPAGDPINDPDVQLKFGNGRINMARALEDTSTDPVQPAGADPVGEGGPYVGPYGIAAVSITAATGGTNISADKAANASSPQTTTLGDIVIQEGGGTFGDFGSPGGTLILTAPSGWQFIAGTETVTYTVSKNITSASISVSSPTTITVTFAVGGTDKRDALTISGIQVQATNGANLPASGNILRTSSSPGTASINGVTNDVTPFGSLSQVVGAANKLAFGVQPSNTSAGAVITPAVTVRILDQFSNLTASTASVTVAIGSNPGGGTLSGTTSQNASGGVATFSNLSINKPGTGYTLTASSTGLTGTTSNTFDINVGAASKLTFSQQPSNTTAGASITPAVTVRVEDSAGNLITTSTASITVAIGTNPPGTGILSGTLTVSALGGVATFSNLSIDKVGTGYTLTAASTGLTGATSTAFNITVGAASKLAFGVQPSNTTAGASITPAVTVRVEDSAGNLITTSTASITVAIGTNPPGTGILSGTLTVSALGGVATFSNLSVDKVGTGYTLTAASTGLTGATSNTFNITAGGIDHFGFSAIGTQTVGTPFSITIYAQDVNDNTVTTYSNNVNLSTNAGNISPTSVSVTNGVWSATVTVTAAGTGRTITADRSSKTGTSNAFAVNKADTTTTITADTPDPSVVGQAYTVAYTVSVQTPGSGTPTGNVTVSDGTASCTGTVVTGSCSLTSTSAGPKTLTATYAGDANFNGSTTSLGTSHQVNMANTTTTITSDTPDPSAVGEAYSVNFTVSVQTPGSGTPTGNVTVSDGTASCTGTVATGSCSLTSTTAGAKTLIATYAGDSNFNGSTSAGAPHQVNKASTTTTITTDSPDPSVVGQAYTVTFTVSGSGTPTGNVTVSDSTDSCTGTVATGNCSLTSTTAGSKTLIATYAGDGNFNGSTSAEESHQVNLITTSLAVASASGAYGGTVDLSAKLTQTSDGSSISGKVVSFALNGNPVCGVPSTPPCPTTAAHGHPDEGIASLNGVSLAGINAGTYPSGVSASFAGDTNYSGSSGTNFLTVSKADQTINFDTLATKTFGDPPFDVSATASSGLTVSFSSETPLTCSVSGQTVTILGAGTCKILASVDGNDNYNPATKERPFTIEQAASSTTVDDAKAAYSLSDQILTLTAKVTSGAGTVNEGTVTFTVWNGSTQIGSAAVSGTVTGNAASASYTLPGGTAVGSYNIQGVYNGTDFGSSTGNGTLTVDTPPVGRDDYYITYKNTALIVGAAAGVLVNDYDADGNPLRALKVSDPTYGNLTLTLDSDGYFDGSFTYTPTDPNFTGTDTFTYKVNDGFVDNTDPVTVTIYVLGDTTGPIAVNDAYNLNKSSATTLTMDILANDNDPSGNPLTAINLTTPAHGTLTFNPSDKTYMYTLTDATFIGADSFTYQVNNGTKDSKNTAMVLINVRADDVLVADNDSYRTDEDTPLPVSASGPPCDNTTVALCNDTIPAGHTVSAELVSGPTFGTLSTALAANGSFTYTPNTDFSGVDTFFYRLHDTTAATYSDVAMVTIRVRARPVFSNLSAPTITYGQTPTSIGGTIKAGSLIPPGSVDITLNGVTHSATIQSDGTFSYAFATGALGVSAFPYTISFSYTGNDIFTDASDSSNLTVQRADPTCNVTGYSVTYDGNPHTATGSCTGIGGPSDVLSGLGLSGTTHTNAGDWPNDPWTFTDSTGNYNNKSGTVHDHIDKADAICTVNGYTGTYDGNAHGASGSCTGVGGADLNASLNLGATFTNVPGGTAHWTFTGGTNYKDQSGDVPITINRADATCLVTGYNVTYDGNSHTATGSCTGVKSEVLSGLDLSNTTRTNAGDYTDTWTFTDITGNYNNITNGSVNDHIGRADTSTALNSDTNPAKTGDNVTFTAIVTNTVNSATPAGDVTFKDGDCSTGTALDTKTLDGNGHASFSTSTLTVGTHKISACYAGDGNFNGSENSLDQVVDTPPAGMKDYYLTLKNHGLVVGAPGVLLNDYDADGNPLTVDTGVPRTKDPSGALNYLNTDGSFSYTPISDTTGEDTFTYNATDLIFDSADITVHIYVIDPASTDPVAVNDSYTWNKTSLTTLTMDILANDNDPSGNPLTAINLTTPAHGTLTFNPSDKTYMYTLTDATFIGADSFTYQVNNGTKDSKNTAMVLINVRADDVLVADNDVYSTDQDTPLPVSASGPPCDNTTVALCNDTIPAGHTVSAELVSGPTFGTLSTPLGVGGSFTYTPNTGFSGVDTFFYRVHDGTDDTYSNVAMVKIRVRAIPIFSNLSEPTITYGDTPTTLSGTIKAGSLIPPGNVSITLNSVTHTAAIDPATGNFSSDFATGTLGVSGSPYTITYSYTGNDIFTDASNSSKLTVIKKAASVTPNAASKTYGDPDPPLTGTLRGFLAGDGVTATYSRTAGETVAGSPYTISATLSPAGVLDNYDITYNTANFTITKRAITVTADAKSKTYGDADPALTYKITSGSLAFSDAFSGALTRDPGENVGTYAIKQGMLALSSNYNLTYVGANLTITARPITVTADAKSKTYGDDNPALTATVTGTVNGDTLNYSLSTTATKTSGAGYYPITVTLGSNPNYDVTKTDGVLTINKAAATVTLSNMTQTYTGSPLTPTATTAPIGLTIGWTNAPQTNAGSYYPVTATVNDLNYEGSASGTFVIHAWTLKGFYQPVDMTITTLIYNTVKNGSTVPLKFEIFAGSTELTNTSSVKSLTYAQTSCDVNALTDDIETTATGGTVLRYDTTDGQFIYNWKTPNTAGKCYRVTMTTLDGSSLVAYFKLK
jgi:hypothetical protein